MIFAYMYIATINKKKIQAENLHEFKKLVAIYAPLSMYEFIIKNSIKAKEKQIKKTKKTNI